MTEDRQGFVFHMLRGLRQPQPAALIFLVSMLAFAGMFIGGYIHYASNFGAIPSLNVSFMVRANEFYRSGNHAAAATEYTSAAAIWPTNSRLIFNLGINDIDAGDLQSAIEAYERYLIIKPNSPQIRHALGISYGKIGDYPSAVKHLSQVTNLGPAVYMQLGAAYEGAGQLREAAESYKQASDMAPGFPGAYDKYAELSRRIRQ